MFRQPPLRCLLFTLCVGYSLASPAQAQDRSTEGRLDRIERDLNMLQRQVYRGGPPPPMGQDGGPGAVNVEVRMNRLEEQMRDLTGRVEEFTNQIEQVRRRVEQINGDVDMRFSQAGPNAPPPPAATRPGQGRTATDRPPPRAEHADRGMAFPQPADDDPDDEAMAPRRKPTPLMPPGSAYPPGGPGADFGTLTPPGTPYRSGSEMAAAEAPSRAGPDGGLPHGSSAEQYNYAFGLLKQANYPAAEAALKAFVDQHPKDAMAGNAQYWLGETYYTRGKYMEAASAFAEGYKRYPKSTKAADGLLKLGMSLARANQKQNACVALTQLDRDYPNPGASIKDRAAAEKKRLGC